LGAAAAAPRQRDGEGNRPGVPVAELLESGTYGTVGEVAAADKINASYIGRILRLTPLAPEIVEAILDGRQPAETTLELMRPFPVAWATQRLHLLAVP
jgi:hypothetical protein